MITARLSGGVEAGWLSCEEDEESELSGNACPGCGPLWLSITSALYTTQETKSRIFVTSLSLSACDFIIFHCKSFKRTTSPRFHYANKSFELQKRMEGDAVEFYNGCVLLRIRQGKICVTL